MQVYQTVPFISRRVAEAVIDVENGPRRALISITSPPDRRSRPAKLVEGAWGDVLRLEFHDSDPSKLPKKHHHRVLFHERDAVAILKFMKLNEHREQLVVHCEAGISRSAAVAKFAGSIYHLFFPEGYSLHNRHVFSTLWAVYNRSLYDGTPILAAELPGKST